MDGGEKGRGELMAGAPARIGSAMPHARRRRRVSGVGGERPKNVEFNTSMRQMMLLSAREQQQQQH